MNGAHSYTEGMDVPRVTASKTFLKMCRFRKTWDLINKKDRRAGMIVMYAIYIGMEKAQLMKI